MNELLNIYVQNSREVYLIIEWLTNCVAKKIRKGVTPDLEHLANCSAMKKVITIAAKIQFENEGFKPLREERKRVAYSTAEYIIESAKFIVA